MSNRLTLLLPPALFGRVMAYARRRRLGQEAALLELIARGLDGGEGALVEGGGPPPSPLSTAARLKAAFEQVEADEGVSRALDAISRPRPAWRPRRRKR